MKKKISTVIGIAIILAISVPIIFYSLSVIENLSKEKISLVNQEEIFNSLKEIERAKTIERLKQKFEGYGVVIEITSEGFTPQEVALEKEQLAVWFNNSAQICQIMSNGFIKTDELSPGVFRVLVLKESGTFEYYCAEEPEMTGKIIVK